MRCRGGWCAVRRRFRYGAGDVKRAVHTAAEAFDVKNGGAFFYVETDNGFPLENIRALLETIGEYRTEEK